MFAYLKTSDKSLKWFNYNIYNKYDKTFIKLYYRKRLFFILFIV